MASEWQQVPSCFVESIWFILLYLKIDVMPLVETKMADVGKLISLGNLLARKTTWLVLTTTSVTSILSRVFGANCMTKIVYKYSNLPTVILFPLWLPERTLSLSSFRLTESIHSSSFLHLTSSSQPPRKCNHSLPCYTFSVRRFPASNTTIKISANPEGDKQLTWEKTHAF